MATRRTSFGKLQRDRAKQATAAAKRERRQDRSPAEEEVAVIPEEGELSAAQLLVLIEQIHKQFDDKVIDFDEFEEKKAELMARLPID
ncbi:MAG: hypothetical protein JWN29_2107 [Acidimicrobiales bacterium]|jgi:hypothetical protein|nr:hypothetical protein [Acidimicrobiales bacterium]